MDYFDYDRSFDAEEFLRTETDRERDRLGQELARVDELLEERAEIHAENVEEMESKLEWYLDRLERGYRQARGQETISELKGKIEELYANLRQERRSQWRDRLELELEKIEVERALQEVDDQDSIWEWLNRI